MATKRVTGQEVVGKPEVITADVEKKMTKQEFIEKGVDFTSVFEAVQNFGNVLTHYGIDMTLGGNWQGLTFKRSSPVSWGGESYQVMKKMSASNPGHIGAIREILGTVITRTVVDKEIYFEFCRALLDYSNNSKRGIVLDAVTGRDAEVHYKAYPMSKKEAFTLLRPTGRKGTEHIDKLICWLPESERRLLALTIGRLFSLGKGNWRVVPLISGRPGLGKSTFIKRISDKLKTIGFDTPYIQPNLSRFSLTRELVQSHLLIADDTTTADIHALTKNSQFKSLITGLSTVIEEKYKQAVEVKPNCVVMFLGNGIKPSDLIGADTGILDRLTILECDPDYDGNTDQPFQDMAEFTGITEEELTERLIEECIHLYDNTIDMEATVNALRGSMRSGCTGQALVEVSVAMSYLQFVGSNTAMKDALEGWSVLGVIQSILQSGKSISPKLTATFREVLWEQSISNLRFLMMNSTTISPAMFFGAIVTKSGVTLPKTIAPYRKLVAEELPNHSNVADVLNTFELTYF
jgi:hypothetical protein